MFGVVGDLFGRFKAEIRIVDNADVKVSSQYSFGRVPHYLVHCFFAVLLNTEFIGFHGQIYALLPGPSLTTEGIASGFKDRQHAFSRSFIFHTEILACYDAEVGQDITIPAIHSSQYGIYFIGAVA